MRNQTLKKRSFFSKSNIRIHQPTENIGSAPFCGEQSSNFYSILLPLGQSLGRAKLIKFETINIKSGVVLGPKKRGAVKSYARAAFCRCISTVRMAWRCFHSDTKTFTFHIFGTGRSHHACRQYITHFKVFTTARELYSIQDRRKRRETHRGVAFCGCVVCRTADRQECRLKGVSDPEQPGNEIPTWRQPNEVFMKLKNTS